MLFFFVPYALFILFLFNSLTYNLVLRTEMSQEKQPLVFRTINILITILLLSFYIEVRFGTQ